MTDRSAAVEDGVGDQVVEEKDPFAEQIREAWQSHSRGDNARALAIFQQVLSQDPNHIDANYGAGMALSAIGRFMGLLKPRPEVKLKHLKPELVEEMERQIKLEAIASFERVLELVDGIRKTQPGRATMLERLCRRKIEDLRSDEKPDE